MESSNSFSFVECTNILAALGLTLWSAHRCLTKELIAKEAPFLQLPNNLRVFIASETDEIIPLLTKLNKDLKTQKHSVVGFDLEWKPTHSGHSTQLALMQLSTNNICVLIRLCNMKHLPDYLLELLTDSRIIKAGVAIAADAKLLYEQFGVVTKGAVDIQHFAHKYDRVHKSSGLAALAESILNVRLNKDHHIRCGDWEASTLSQEQTQYAALDAWVGCALLEKLYTDHPDGYGDIVQWSSSAADVIFKHSYTPKSSTNGKTKNNTNDSKIEKLTKFPARKTELYNNILMQAPDGEVLCGISKKKAEWYLAHDNIAEMIETEDQIYIRLKNEPKGRGHAGDEYYTSKKENKCVVCGKDGNLCRFSIVPQAYRRLMPESVKSHSSHDIVLLCQLCLRNTSISYDGFKKNLAKDLRILYHAPQYEVDKELQCVVKAAQSMAKYTEYYSEEKKAPLIKILREHYKLEEHEELTQELIEAALKIEYKKHLHNESHEELVVKSLVTEQHLEDFVIKWRTHFVNTMQPKHMPTGWKIDHPVLVKD